MTPLATNFDAHVHLQGLHEQGVIVWERHTYPPTINGMTYEVATNLEWWAVVVHNTVTASFYNIATEPVPPFNDRKHMFAYQGEVILPAVTVTYIDMGITVVFPERTVQLTKYMIYYEDGTYPLLDNWDPVPPEEAIYPVIPIRLDNVSIDSAYPNSDVYNDVRGALKKVSISLDDIVEQLNANPDIGDIDDAFITFALNIQSDTPAAIEGLMLTMAIIARNTVLVHEPEALDGQFPNETMSPAFRLVIK